MFARLISGEIDVLIEVSDDNFREPRSILNENDLEQMESIEEGKCLTLDRLQQSK